MKILHILSQLPARTGSGVYFNNLIKGMARKGHDQRAIFAVQDGFTYEGLPAEHCCPVEFGSEALPFPIVGMSDVMPYPTLRYADMGGDKMQQWQAVFRTAMLRMRDEFNPDVVILHHLWVSTAMAVELFPDAYKVGVCHNTDIRQAEQHADLQARYVRGLEQLDTVFTLSDAQKELIARVYGLDTAKMVTVGGGFDEELFFPLEEKPKRKSVRIVFAAKVERSKGVFELVKAFRKLSAEKDRIYLDIIGTPDEENLDRLRNEIGTAQNIYLLGVQQQKKLAEIVRTKDIFVMPSYFEGLGLIAIECLASGLRAVATEIEGLMSLLGERVNNSGVIEYVPLPRLHDVDRPYEEDMDAFVDALAEKLRVQVERVERGEPFPTEIREDIMQHSWAAITDRVECMLRDAVK